MKAVAYEILNSVSDSLYIFILFICIHYGTRYVNDI